MEWFERVLHWIPNRSAIVIDRASCNTMQDPETRNPTKKWTKYAIIDWLHENGIESKNNEGHPIKLESIFKQKLIEMAEPKFRKKELLLERLIRESDKDIKLVWTPVVQCELNAIELIWAYVKGRVAKENTSFKGNGVEELVKSILYVRFLRKSGGKLSAMQE
jgi:hypothetical protein